MVGFVAQLADGCVVAVNGAAAGGVTGGHGHGMQIGWGEVWAAAAAPIGPPAVLAAARRHQGQASACETSCFWGAGRGAARESAPGLGTACNKEELAS